MPAGDWAGRQLLPPSAWPLARAANESAGEAARLWLAALRGAVASAAGRAGGGAPAAGLRLSLSEASVGSGVGFVAPQPRAAAQARAPLLRLHGVVFPPF